jgi:hypothetical protein
VSDLEPDVDLGQRTRRVLEDVTEALRQIIRRRESAEIRSIRMKNEQETHVEGRRVLVLLLVNNSESEIDLVCLLEHYK